MKAKDKVLKVYPNAICKSNPLSGIWINCRPSHKPINYQIVVGDKKISQTQCRESWAWAEAYRCIQSEFRMDSY